MAGPEEWHVFNASGRQVKLPVKPYPSQMSMMTRVLESLSKFKNSLIESPTGTGKTLALLSSSLAWYFSEKERLQKEQKEKENLLESTLISDGVLESSLLSSDEKVFGSVSSEQQILELQIHGTPMSVDDSFSDVSAMDQNTPGIVGSPASVDFDGSRSGVSKNRRDLSDEDFTETPGSMKRRKICETPGISKAHRQSDVRAPFRPPCRAQACCSNDGRLPIDAEKESAELEGKLPKIYYGTRTHKQIAQVVAELRRTPYSSIKHTILSSRESTCIHPQVSKQSKKNQACRDLLAPEGLGCKFYHGLKKKFEGNANAMRALIKAMANQKLVHATWDIEDLVKVGTIQKFCPYFAATRLLPKNAELIFCPYNYLIDPVIRESMEINLKGDIVILDEAHNIEDACREAASFSITEEELKECVDNFRTLIMVVGANNTVNAHSDTDEMREYQEMVEKLQGIYQYFRYKCEELRKWLNTKASQDTRIKNQAYECDMGVWTGAEILLLMKDLGWYSKEVVDEDVKKLKTIAKPDGDFDPNRNVEENKFLIPLSTTLNTIEKLMHFLKFFLKGDSGLDDYKMVIEKKMSFEFEEDCPDEEGFFTKQTKRRKSHRVAKSVTMLHFWCLNPALTFRDAFENTRAVILASGTLCPTETFKSELGLEFSLSLEACHVLPRNRLFASTINTGPRNGGLRCTFQRYNEFSFQDELGRVVGKVCHEVPGGVLVFLPSYFLLNKLGERWNATGLLSELNKLKVVIFEPRSGEQLKSAMDDFYRAARDPRSFSESITGGVFFAVLRGKVSEGLDFADQDARAVITVGIPYPSIKDLQVDLKKQYNDRFCKSRSLLPGRVWYETQAFRALNQALGRCLRHKKDWGALILVDERFSERPQTYCTGISKWIRKELRHFTVFDQFLHELRDFVERLESEGDLAVPPSPALPSLHSATMTPNVASVAGSVVVTPVKPKREVVDHVIDLS